MFRKPARILPAPLQPLRKSPKANIWLSHRRILWAHFFARRRAKKPGFPLQSFLPLRGKKGFPLQSLAPPATAAELFMLRINNSAGLQVMRNLLKQIATAGLWAGNFMALF
jgi:hypothetical protein